jgi:MFS family permease
MPENRRELRALLVALGLDNFGSGAFLPLTIVFLIRVVHLDVGAAGSLVGLASLVGLLVPAVASRVVDHVGARPLVVVSQLVQGLGMVGLLLAGGPVLASLAVAMSVAGLQLFYSCLSTLVADVAGPGPKDLPFTLVARVRGATFGLGALAGSGIASLGDPAWLRVSVVVNLATFVVAAAILWLGVHPTARVRTPTGGGGPAAVLSSRPFVGLMVVAFCTALPLDFLLSGHAVYVTEYLGVGAWVVGVSIALLTALSSTLGTVAVRLTDRFSRPATQAIGVALLAGWILTSVTALALPQDSRAGILLGSAVLVAVANVVPMARLAAMAEATAPDADKGRFLAVFQYPFSFAQVVAPALTSLLALAAWLPWAVLAAALLVALGVLRWLRTALPGRAVHVEVDHGLAVRR